jgi:diacylglycerol kinase (ATP)
LPRLLWMPGATAGKKSDAMLTGIRSAWILFNPATGPRRGRRLADLEAARKILAAAGIAAELAPTSAPDAATSLAREAVRSRLDLVIACGGDGTINETANGLATSHVPLAILPAGTANVLAKELRIPWNIPAAARLIPSGRLHRIALGLAVSPELRGGQRYFVAVAGAGPDGSMIYSVNHRVKCTAGILAYWLEGLRHFLAYDMTPFEVSVADRKLPATLLVVSRTKNYGGPFRITTGASLFDPSFEVAVFTNRNRLRYLLHIPAVWLGLHRQLGDIEFFRAAAASCRPTGRARIHAQLDGETAGHLPVEFRIVPDALTLVVPEHFVG